MINIILQYKDFTFVVFSVSNCKNALIGSWLEVKTKEKNVYHYLSEA